MKPTSPRVALKCMAAAAVGAALAGPAAQAESFFAAAVVDFANGPGVTPGQGFGITDRLLGGPRGAGCCAGSLDVLTLGVGGAVTVSFDDPGRHRRVFDGPGPDLIVFENGFFIAGNPHSCFGELAFVEVSSDGIHFARIPNQSLTSGPVGPYGGIDPDLVDGLAGSLPVFANVDTNQIDPFDPRVAGGNAFDLSDLADDPLVSAGLVRLHAVRFVRIVDILGDGTTADSQGGPIYDPTGFTNAADVDAVAVVNGCTVGDANADGRVDAADVPPFVAALLTPDSAAEQPCLDFNADGAVDGTDLPLMVNLVLSGGA